MLQQPPNLSQTVARLRQKPKPEATDADSQIDQAARKLEEMPGDFIFVGASPIRIGLQLMKLAPDRDCCFVPFSGGWMYPAGVDAKDFHIYKRERMMPSLPLDKYRDRLLPDLIEQALKDRQSPLNIIDCFNTGRGQISFADMLIDQASSTRATKKIAANLHLISITEKAEYMSYHLGCHWRTRRDNAVDVGCTLIPISSATWNMLIGCQGIHYGKEPRLTAPYLPKDWNEPPKPARPENIAAFWKAAKCIDPAKLKHLRV